MTKGWHITVVDGDQNRVFKVGISDSEKATQAVREKYPQSSNFLVLPLKGGEFEQIVLSVGEIREV